MLYVFQMEQGVNKKVAEWDAYISKKLEQSGDTCVLLPSFIKPLFATQVNADGETFYDDGEECYITDDDDE